MQKFPILLGDGISENYAKSGNFQKNPFMGFPAETTIPSKREKNWIEVGMFQKSSSENVKEIIASSIVSELAHIRIKET